MSKNVKIAVAFIITGIILVIVGYMMGGRGFVITNGEVHIEDEYQVFEYENFEIDNLETIDVNIENLPVNICESENGKYGVIVKCLVVNQDDVDVNIDDNKLEVIKKAQNYIFSFDYNALLSKRNVKEEVIIYVPKENDKLEITIDTSNADVIVEGTATSFDKMVIKTSNATVKVDEIVVKNELDVGTSNGAIKINESICPVDVKLVTSNGEIAVSQTKLKSLDAKTGNGEVTIENVEFSEGKNFVKVKTYNAPINASFANKEKDFKIVADTSNADVYIDGESIKDDVYKTNTGDIPLNLNSSNGKIDIEFGTK